ARENGLEALYKLSVKYGAEVQFKFNDPSPNIRLVTLNSIYLAVGRGYDASFAIKHILSVIDTETGDTTVSDTIITRAIQALNAMPLRGDKKSIKVYSVDAGALNRIKNELGSELSEYENDAALVNNTILLIRSDLSADQKKLLYMKYMPKAIFNMIAGEEPEITATAAAVFGEIKEALADISIQEFWRDTQSPYFDQTRLNELYTALSIPLEGVEAELQLKGEDSIAGTFYFSQNEAIAALQRLMKRTEIIYDLENPGFVDIIGAHPFSYADYEISSPIIDSTSATTIGNFTYTVTRNSEGLVKNFEIRDRTTEEVIVRGKGVDSIYARENLNGELEVNIVDVDDLHITAVLNADGMKELRIKSALSPENESKFYNLKSLEIDASKYSYLFGENTTDKAVGLSAFKSYIIMEDRNNLKADVLYNADGSISRRVNPDGSKEIYEQKLIGFESGTAALDENNILPIGADYFSSLSPLRIPLKEKIDNKIDDLVKLAEENNLNISGAYFVSSLFNLESIYSFWQHSDYIKIKLAKAFESLYGKATINNNLSRKIFADGSQIEYKDDGTIDYISYADGRGTPAYSDIRNSLTAEELETLDAIHTAITQNAQDGLDFSLTVKVDALNSPGLIDILNNLAYAGMISLSEVVNNTFSVRSNVYSYTLAEKGTADIENTLASLATANTSASAIFANYLNNLPAAAKFIDYGVHYASGDVLRKIAQSLNIPAADFNNLNGLTLKSGVILIRNGLDTDRTDAAFIHELDRAILNSLYTNPASRQMVLNAAADLENILNAWANSIDDLADYMNIPRQDTARSETEEMYKVRVVNEFIAKQEELKYLFDVGAINDASPEFEILSVLAYVFSFTDGRLQVLQDEIDRVTYDNDLMNPGL
ncbi:MAG: hypothetical protein Q8R48_07345, partial [Candidatus Omnitrophota bacterium]|nr:hypothetical protein [Candidatus Omnitrophota bacterium]